MSVEVDRFIPVATMLAALVIGFAMDPTASRPMLFAAPVGFFVGLILRTGLRRHFNAR